MKFGLTLPGIPARELLETARKAEDLGYESLYVPDHWAYEHQGGSGLDDQMLAWEATTMLGAIAAATTRARIGALVLCNLFRHPGTTAQVTSTLDHISNGRAMLGLGSGWTRAEFEMMGAPFPDVKPRLRMLDEALEVIKRLWTEQRASFDGEFYKLRDAISVPKPVQKPRPPIMLGGSGKGLLRIAARHADIVNIVADTGKAGTIDPREVAKVTDAGFRDKIDFLRAETKAAGRDVKSVTLSSTIFIGNITDSEDEAGQMAGALGGMFGLEAAEVQKMPLALIGTPKQCIAELKRRESQWGITHYILSERASPGFAERFAAEIMPHV
jgi:probable F420-dependent oxidoreductase